VRRLDDFALPVVAAKGGWGSAARASPTTAEAVCHEGAPERWASSHITANWDATAGDADAGPADSADHRKPDETGQWLGA
jgi:hypothetical protein